MAPQEQRELIEDCAKAIGIATTNGVLDFVHKEGIWRPCGIWNPLTSAADCEMLECGLELCIEWEGPEVWAYRNDDHLICGVAAFAPDTDKPQAKRLAVCRAAQEYQRRKGR